MRSTGSDTLSYRHQCTVNTSRVILTLYVCVQSESSRAEISLLLTKLQSEESSLRDSLAKMSNINESLAHDKSDLNGLIIQVNTHD